MKLFIITIEDVYDGTNNHVTPIVKTSIEEARKELNRLYDSAKETYEEQFDEFEKSEDCFDMYESGYYCQNHYSAVIDTVEVPDIQEKVTE